MSKYYVTKINGVVYSSAGAWPTESAYDASGGLEEMIAAAGTGHEWIIDGGPSGITYSGTDLTEDGTGFYFSTLANNTTIRGAYAADGGGRSGKVTIDGSAYDDEAFTFSVQGGVVENLDIKAGPWDRFALLTSSSPNIIFRKVRFIGNDTARIYSISTTSTVLFDRCEHIDFTNSSAGVNIAGDTKWFYNAFSNMHRYLFFSAGTHKIVNPIFSGGRSYYVYLSSGSTADVDIINPVILPYVKTSPSGTDPLLRNLSTGGSLTVSNGKCFRNWRKPNTDSESYVGVTDGGANNGLTGAGNLSIGYSSRRTGIVTIGVDDSYTWSWSVVQSMMDMVEANGMSMTWAIMSRWIGKEGGYPTWDNIRSYIDRGHEISSHTRSHCDLTNLVGFDIRFVGTATTATLSLVDTNDDGKPDRLQTTVDGVGDLDIDLSAHWSIFELCAYINTNHGSNYTATTSDSISAIGSYSGNTAPENLNITSITDINGVDHSATLNQTNFFDYEIDGAKFDIESNLGITCDAFVYPQGNSSAPSRAAVKSAGHTIARASNTINSGYAEFDLGVNVYQSPAASLSESSSPLLTDPTYYDRNAQNFTEYLAWQGGLFSLYLHSFSEFTEQNFSDLLDILAGSPVRVMTLSGAYNWMAANCTEASDIYTKSDWADNTPVVSSAGDVVDAGAWDNDAHGVGNPALNEKYVFRLPDIGPYEYNPSGGGRQYLGGSRGGDF